MTARATTPTPWLCGLPAASLDVQVLSLSRNFGKEAALTAGLHHARHGALLFMDGDGQHSRRSGRAAGRRIGRLTAMT